MKEVQLKDFQIKLQIGQGSFGKVFLATFSEKEYAIKVIRKDVLLENDQIESTLLEKDILMAVDHPNLCSMDYLF